MTPDNIRSIREVFKLSQRDLAKALNVSPATVARWEVAGQTGGHSPTGLQSQVLEALYGVAEKVRDDEEQKQMIRSRIVLGIGALIFYLLTRK
jgi:DNA-binding transcriptional regulator YiaG